MADPLSPRKPDLCLVADAVLIAAREGRLPREFPEHSLEEGMRFLLRMGLGPELNEMVVRARNLKGGTEK